MDLREQFRNQLHGKEVHFHIPNSVSFHVCNKPLSAIKRTSIRELKCEVISEGYYLLLITLEPPLKSSGVMCLVQDHLGDEAICFLYDHVFLDLGKPVDDRLPVGTVLVLKEPCLKSSSGKNQVVVVGSPSDVLTVDRTHPLIKEAYLLGWKKDEGIKTVEDWRCTGNSFFRSARYLEAIEAYSLALEACKDLNTELILCSNLAAAYLATDFYEFALEFGSRALSIDENNEKALYRTGRAYYLLKNYVCAEQCFQTLVKSNPSNRSAALELSRCGQRLKEARGEVDVQKLFLDSVKEPLASVDFGSYFAQVRILPFAGKGRCVVSTIDMEPGTLVLAEKALAANLVEDGRGADGLTRRLASPFMKNTRTIAKQIFNLSSNDSKRDENRQTFADEGKYVEPVVDYPRLLAIVNTNSFSLDPHEERGSCLSSKRGLFYHASFFNHSCLCNCSYEIFNDVITVRTLTRIRKGEELTIPYVTNTESFVTRERIIASHGFVCTCELCQLDRRESVEVHELRDALWKEFTECFRTYFGAAIVSGTATLHKNELVKKVAEMEATYSDRKKFRVHLFRLYLLVAQTLENQAPKMRTKFFEVVDEGLACAGLSTECLLKCAEDEQSSLNADGIISKLLYQYASACARAESSYGHPEQAKRWVRVLLMLERIFTGGNSTTLQVRFKDSPLMSMLIKKFSS